MAPCRRAAPPLFAVPLLAAAIACAPAASGDARAALERCARSSFAGGVRFECPDFRAGVEEHEGLTPIELVDLYGAGLRELGKGYASSPFSMELDGRRWEGFRFAAGGGGWLGKESGEWLVATARIGGGTARLASCTTLGWFARGRCAGVAELLAATGPTPWRTGTGTPSFLGRRLEIPEGCDVQAASGRRLEIRCGSEAALLATVLGSRDDIGQTVDVMRDLVHRGASQTADERRVACRIAGAETRCVVVGVGSGSGRVVSVLGAAVVAGEPVFVMCSQPAAQTGVHPDCAGILSCPVEAP